MAMGFVTIAVLSTGALRVAVWRDGGGLRVWRFGSWVEFLRSDVCSMVEGWPWSVGRCGSGVVFSVEGV